MTQSPLPWLLALVGGYDEGMEQNPHQSSSGQGHDRRKTGRGVWLAKELFGISCGLVGGVMALVVRKWFGVTNGMAGFMFIVAGIGIGSLIALRVSPLIFGTQQTPNN